MTFKILGELLTFISYLVFWISRFFKKKNNILLWDNISRIIAIIAFCFLVIILQEQYVKWYVL